jgi:hypothetical protein
MPLLRYTTRAEERADSRENIANRVGNSGNWSTLVGVSDVACVTFMKGFCHGEG